MSEQTLQSSAAPTRLVDAVRQHALDRRASDWLSDSEIEDKCIAAPLLDRFIKGDYHPTVEELCVLARVVRCNLWGYIGGSDITGARTQPGFLNEDRFLKELRLLSTPESSRRLDHTRQLPPVLFRLKRALRELEDRIAGTDPHRCTKLAGMIEDCDDAERSPIALRSLLVMVAACLTKRIHDDVENHGKRFARDATLDSCQV